MRRIIARLAVVRPPAEELNRAADAAATFADRLDELPERTRSWEISEAGLLPRDFVAFSPVSGRSNPMSPPVKLHVAEGDEGQVVIEGEATSGRAKEGRPGPGPAGGGGGRFAGGPGFPPPPPG